MTSLDSVSLQITFVCCVYPVLLVSYAGQAAFISKNWQIVQHFNHLSRSIPGGYSYNHDVFLIFLLFFSIFRPHLLFLTHDCLEGFNRVSRSCSAWFRGVIAVCFSGREPSINYGQLLDHKPAPGT